MGANEESYALEMLRRAIGSQLAVFRAGQWEAIDSLVNGRERRLVVERTGWGKSIVYFVATKIFRNQGYGPTLVVSPLLALMRNQIDAAIQLDIAAISINSTNRQEWPRLREQIRKDRADILLVSPERFSNDEFVADILLPVAESVGLLVVDEAHCISDWGHDFRPDYRRLVNVLRRLPQNVPVLGTTATANNRVIQDIKRQLGDFQIQRGPLMRETLALQTMRMPTQTERLAWLADHIDDLPGTGIIYTLTKRDANQVASWLQLQGIMAQAYYSDVSSEDFENSDSYRQHLEQRLQSNDIKVLVATTALGMGYDKPDLGFVIHYQAPSSVVAYYQQVGRAGRAISHALGILMSGREDEDIQLFFRRNAFPNENWVKSILDALERFDGLTVRELESIVNLRFGQIEQVLKYLSVENPAPVIKVDRYWRRTPTSFQMDHQSIRRLTQQREMEWEEIQRYIAEKGCLMQFLAKALDDLDHQACGKCSSCTGGPVVDYSFTNATAISAARFLRHSEFDLKCNRQVAPDSFPQYGFQGNIPSHLRAEIGRTLSRWGDAAWGHMVAEDKRQGHFREELVQAVVEMLRDRWRPSPFPLWVTCIPSKNSPELVPSFAKRLADALNLPFRPVIVKIKDNDPQKQQHNRYHQCRNLDGVFGIERTISTEPVLLVDDVIDSGWTLTVTAALLRQAGSGPVWPLALASSSVGN